MVESASRRSGETSSSTHRRSAEISQMNFQKRVADRRLLMADCNNAELLIYRSRLLAAEDEILHRPLLHFLSPIVILHFNEVWNGRVRFPDPSPLAR